MGQMPATTKTKLVVLWAFDKDENGVLQPAFEPREMPDEDLAIRRALEVAQRHVGVIAWSRDADMVLGEFGPSIELFREGEVPDLD